MNKNPTIERNGETPLVFLDTLLCEQLAQARKEVIFDRIASMFNRPEVLAGHMDRNEELIERFTHNPQPQRNSEMKV